MHPTYTLSSSSFLNELPHLNPSVWAFTDIFFWKPAQSSSAGSVVSIKTLPLSNLYERKARIHSVRCKTSPGAFLTGSKTPFEKPRYGTLSVHNSYRVQIPLLLPLSALVFSVYVEKNKKQNFFVSQMFLMQFLTLLSSKNKTSWICFKSPYRWVLIPQSHYYYNF